MSRIAKCYEREVIKDVHAGLLRVYPDGTIWTHAKRVKHGYGGRVSIEPIVPIRAETLHTTGYMHVRRWRGNIQIKVVSHRLVWQFFKGDIPPDKCINHIDGNPLNNRIDNLEVTTYSENIAHAHRLRLHDVRGEINGFARHSDELVLKVKSEYAAGLGTISELARRYGLNRSYVDGLCKRGYRDVPAKHTRGLLCGCKRCVGANPTRHMSPAERNLSTGKMVRR